MKEIGRGGKEQRRKAVGDRNKNVFFLIKALNSYAINM
jgi:hypothetical protein